MRGLHRCDWSKDKRSGSGGWLIAKKWPDRWSLANFGHFCPFISVHLRAIKPPPTTCRNSQLQVQTKLVVGTYMHDWPGLAQKHVLLNSGRYRHLHAFVAPVSLMYTQFASIITFSTQFALKRNRYSAICPQRRVETEQPAAAVAVAAATTALPSVIVVWHKHHNNNINMRWILMNLNMMVSLFIQRRHLEHKWRVTFHLQQDCILLQEASLETIGLTLVHPHRLTLTAVIAHL